MEQNKNLNPPAKPGGKNPKFSLSWIYGIVILFIVGSYFFGENTPVKEIDSYPKFKEFVLQGHIDYIDVYPQKNMVEAVVKNNTESMKLVFGKNFETYKAERKITVKIPGADKFDEFISESKFQNVSYKESKDYLEIFLYSVLPILLMVGLFLFLTRRMSGQMGGSGGPGGIFNVGKSKAQLFDKGNANKITFKDVAGLAGAKQEIEEIVAFLKNPGKYTELGGKIPKGALLVGPPGTGKTLLAKR